MKANYSLFIVLVSLLSAIGVSHQASAQTWSFGFENADYTGAGGAALVFDQPFDSVSNSSAAINNSYVTGTTNNFVFGGDYAVVTGFDAQQGSNFGYLSTDHICFGVDGTAIGLVNGQQYSVSFYIAALDPVAASDDFSVSGAFEVSNGTTGQIYGTEQGRDYNTANPTAGHTFSNPGFVPAATLTNDKTNLGWTLYSMNFTYDSTESNLYFSGLGDSGVGKNLAIDSIQIEAVPEPSSVILCLLGAGFWVFFGRRRRQTN